MARRPSHQCAQRSQSLRWILLGAGGHAESCVACLESSGMTIVGFLDRAELAGTMVAGYPVIGTDGDLERFLPKADAFLVSVGQIESAQVRKRIFDRVKDAGGPMPWFSAATAFVHKSVSIGSGTVIMHRALVNIGSVIGENCILNTGCHLEHGVQIGSHVHISTGAIVNGNCRVGDGSFIGSGVVIRNNISVAPDVVLGIGTVVVKDITTPGTYVGNPARRIR